MTDRSKLLALAEAVEDAQGRDLPMNHEIGSAMHGLGWHAADCLLDFTGSVDAAMRLMPDGAFWKVEDHPSYSLRAVVEDEQSYGATAALALCAAALRAQAEALS